MSLNMLFAFKETLRCLKCILLSVCTHCIFSEIIAFSMSLDLSLDLGQMSHLISSPSSELIAASIRIFI
jgi:hypothetical protein